MVPAAITNTHTSARVVSAEAAEPAAPPASAPGTRRPGCGAALAIG